MQRARTPIDPSLLGNSELVEGIYHTGIIVSTDTIEIETSVKTSTKGGSGSKTIRDFILSRVQPLGGFLVTSSDYSTLLFHIHRLRSQFHHPNFQFVDSLYQTFFLIFLLS